MVGLSLYTSMDKPRAYVAEHELGWTQGFLGDWTDDHVAESYGVYGIPQIMLIGPDGTVVAKDLRGARIASAIEQFLQTGLDPR